MKLYTEEQVRKAIGMVCDVVNGNNLTDDDIVDSLTPIELPSDEEIIYRCFQEDSYELATDGDSALKTYTDGYKAALEQILKSK